MYLPIHSLYDNKYGQAFFLLDNVNTLFPKPPDDDKNDDDDNNNDDEDDDDNNDGPLADLTNTGVQIIRIRCNTGRGTQDDKDADAVD